MATLEQAVESALPVVQALESRLGEVAAQLTDGAQALEHTANTIEEAWAVLEERARALLEALPAHEGALQDKVSAAVKAVGEVPYVGTSGGGGFELGESVLAAAAPASEAVSRFTRFLREAVAPLHATDLLFREHALLPLARRAAELDSAAARGFDALRAATDDLLGELRGISAEVVARMDTVRSWLVDELPERLEAHADEWQSRWSEVRRAVGEDALGASAGRAALLLAEGRGARAAAAHAEGDALAAGAREAGGEWDGLSAATDAAARDTTARGEDLRAQLEGAQGALAAAAGNLESAQAFLAGLGFGDVR